MPNCTLSVSPCTIEMFSIGRPKRCDDELREGRLVALAVAVRAGQHLDRADRVDPDLGRFPQADAGAERADRVRTARCRRPRCSSSCRCRGACRASPPRRLRLPKPA